MELPLRDVRGRARRCARATPHAVVAGDPRGRGAVVSRQRLAGRASAARDARAAARDGVRAPPVAGVLLTDAEIDHTAGLLLLRESGDAGARLRRAGVERALTHGYPVLEMLRALLRGRVADARAGATLALEGSSLAVEPFEVGGERRAI